VVCSNKEARKPRRLTESERHSRNGHWKHECCFEVVYLNVGSVFRMWNVVFQVMYLYVGSGCRDRNYLYYYDYVYVVPCLVLWVFWWFFYVPSSFSFSFPFLEFFKCVRGLRWMCYGGIVAYYVEYTNVVKKWYGVIVSTRAIKGDEVGFSNSDVYTLLPSCLVTWLQLCRHIFEREADSAEFANLYVAQCPAASINDGGSHHEREDELGNWLESIL